MKLVLTIWEHARGIADPLASSLAELEIRSPRSGLASRPLPATVQAAIANAWQVAIGDVESGRDAVTVDYLASLHDVLAITARADGPGEFSDDGQPTSWGVFLQEATVEGPPEEACLLAQLYWGRHVRSLALSMGWLCMNQVRLRQDQWAIYPPASDHERLLRFLGDAGPGCYDAEPLRALLWEYARKQQPA
jgi:hypothetical protein